MKEKLRQEKLANGTGITVTKAIEITKSASSRSWSGCMTGADWCGTRVYFGHKEISRRVHQQNDAPTGYERRGRYTIEPEPFQLNRGDTLRIATRKAVGRYPDGGSRYATTVRNLTIV